MIILKIHQNTTNYSYTVDVSVSVRDLHQRTKQVPASSSDEVSDRHRNLNSVRIIGCVLMNFQYETFMNQMNLFIDFTVKFQASMHLQWCTGTHAIATTMRKNSADTKRFSIQFFTTFNFQFQLYKHHCASPGCTYRSWSQHHRGCRFCLA